MSQLIQPRTNTIMQTAIHLKTSQNTCVALTDNASKSSTSSSHLLNESRMRFHPGTSGSRPPLSSNNTTPTSTRRSSLSSFSHPNMSSASSDTSTGIPKRYSMKSNLKLSRSVGENMNRTSAPPTVRFLDPEPLPKRNTEPNKTMSLKPSMSESRPVRPEYSRVVSTPILGPHQYQQKKIMVTTLTRPPLLSPASKRASTARSFGDTAGSSRTTSLIQPYQARSQTSSGPVTQFRQRIDKRFSAPVAASQIDSRLDPRWSGIPLPAGFIPPSQNPTSTQRTTSYPSAESNLSSSSPSPAATLPSPAQSTKYDPLQNYIPCMAAMCTAHYTTVHSGSTYYVAQEPYNLSRHHGYCPRHTSKEMKEANALCKKEHETMRQNAGRKTLGVVAQDFEIFLHLYREARQIEDARLQKAQIKRVIGSPQVDSGYDWRYTPRNCTKRGCKSLPYSPFSTKLYPFYSTPNASTQLIPLTILCPRCSKAETEGFGVKLMEKWSSRCGWDGEEWDGWYQSAIHNRKMELEFWEKAQERVVRERLVSKATKDVAEEPSTENSDNPAAPTKEKRKSFFKRMFGRNIAPAADITAIAA